MGNSGLHLCPPGLGQKRVNETHGKVVAVCKETFREAVAEGEVMRKTTAGRPVEIATASGPVERATAGGPVADNLEGLSRWTIGENLSRRTRDEDLDDLLAEQMKLVHLDLLAERMRRICLDVLAGQVRGVCLNLLSPVLYLAFSPVQMRKPGGLNKKVPGGRADPGGCR